MNYNGIGQKVFRTLRAGRSRLVNGFRNSRVALNGYYSVNGIDRFVAPLLPEFGYACDVGANDGLFESNSKYFEDKGWIVLCIEPNPLLVQAGQRNRKLWRQVACGANHHEECLFTIVGDYPYSSGSGFHVEQIPQPLVPTAVADNKCTVVRVEMKMLSLLLTEAGFPRLDYLTIDVEGHERSVLAGIHLGVWKPKIIVVEAWTSEIADELTELLALHNYSLIGKRSLDYVYQRNP